MYIKKLIETKEPEFFTSDTDILKLIKEFDGQAIAWFYHRLEIIESGNLKDIKLDDILKLRAFNIQSELYVWRSNNGLKARLRTDSNTETGGSIAVDTKTFLDPVLTDFKNKNYQKVLTRNYVKYHTNGQAYYDDCRIIEIIK